MASLYIKHYIYLLIYCQVIQSLAEDIFKNSAKLINMSNVIFTEIHSLINELKCHHNDEYNKWYMEYSIIDYEDNSYVSNVLIEKVELLDLTYTNCNFMGLNFVRCTINLCFFQYCAFFDCKFIDCDFTNNRMIDCEFFNCRIEDSKFKSTELSKCSFSDCFLSNSILYDSAIDHSRFSNCTVSSLVINNETIQNSTFENLAFDKEGFVITNSNLVYCHFINNELDKSKISNCQFLSSVFTDCILANSTFGKDNSQISGSYNFIDFQTIIKSEKLSIDILKKHFNIYSDDVKEYVADMTKEFEFQSIFISYSFEDKEFASRLNESLRSYGVLTFFWSLDAPGGKRLKDIMKENIKKKDRLLFIASEHSIKSPACQFELTQGRKKQEDSWSNVFFPIHIDDYLFRVERETIKPKLIQDEYWENIQEIIEFNSIDFSEFIKLGYDNDKFEVKVQELIKSLKKENNL